MEAIDETILNDENDDDLDYDLDPKEENALLQEETEFLEQDYEDEDVLDINVDYDQMDVTDDKSDSASLEKSRNEKRIRRNTDADPNKTRSGKIDRVNKFRNISRLNRKGPLNNPGNKTRRSKTVLINPRFKGPLHVNGRPLAWEKPAVIGQLPSNQHYIQPWSSGSIPNQIVQPMNSYNPAIFVPNNTYTYAQQPQQQILQPPPFAQPQVFMNSLPVMNPAPLLNQNMMPTQPLIQMDPYNNAFQASQMETIQQVPEQPKLPVHQRLGIPLNSFNPPTGNQVQYNSNQPFHNQMAFENQETHHFSQSAFNQQSQIPSINQCEVENSHGNKRFDNVRTPNRHKKQHKKFFASQKVNNRVLLSPSKSSFKPDVQEESVSKNTEENENIQCGRIENTSSSNIAVVPEDEDEETRQYRMKIEEQKKKREEVLRKKEENRLKSLSNVSFDATPSPTVQIARSKPARNFKQKKINYQHRPKQNFQFVKPQVNSNNIVITGNDDQCHFNSRPIKNSYKSTSLRIVTAEPISCSNVGLNTEPFEKEVDPKSLSSFLSNRVVSAQENLMQTNIVVVRNLATATTEPKIMKLCRGIGSVQKLQMETNERQATIHFDTVASAHKFFNKYRRYMIDLSMIQVDLVPCEGSS